ncbi:unnamed protein product, partial [Rotaria sp. Silwood1]
MIEATTEPLLDPLHMGPIFFSNHDIAYDYDAYKVAVDPEQLSKLISALKSTNAPDTEVYGVYGDNEATLSFLQSIFPQSKDCCNAITADTESQPTIWALYNHEKIVLVLTHHTSNREKDALIIIMQKFLQDICSRIFICPARNFFTDFSTEHPFRGQPHGRRTYKVEQKGKSDVICNKTNIENDNVTKSIPNCGSTTVLTTSSTFTYFASKKHHEPSEKEKHDKLMQFKKTLRTKYDLGAINLSQILNVCMECNIDIHSDTAPQIEKKYNIYKKNYDDKCKKVWKFVETLEIEMQKKHSAWETFTCWFTGEESSKKTRSKPVHQIFQQIAEWMIKPSHSSKTAEHLKSDIVSQLAHDTRKKDDKMLSNFNSHHFIATLKDNDQKQAISDIQNEFLDELGKIISASKTNSIGVQLDIYRASYNPIFDAERHLQRLSGVYNTLIQVKSNDMNQLFR